MTKQRELLIGGIAGTLAFLGAIYLSDMLAWADFWLARITDGGVR